mmetsp:Transcript_30695/g.74119  ORF Transcript_30695/g.74119 Transcript_30695/m.74119 type:complete len:347 (-) Transcript_30695:408-1448(-)
MLNAHRNSNESIGNTHLQPILPNHVRVRHNGARRDDALRGTQILAQRPWPLDGIHQFDGISLDVEPEHAAVQPVAMLTISKFLLGMGRESGVDHPAHLGMGFQEGRDFHRRRGLLTDAQPHRFHRLEHEEGGHGRHDVPVHVLYELNPLVQLGSFGHERSPRADVQPVVILGQGLDGEVAPVIEGTAHVRRCERRIAHVQNVMTLGDFGYGIEIGKRQSRVRGTLAEDHLRVGLDRRLDRLRIGKIHKAEFHPQWHELLPTDAIRPPVAAVGDDAVIAGVHEGVDARRGRGHAGGDADGIVSVFDFGNLLLEHLHCGIVRAAVAVPLLEVLVHGFLDECRGHVDRR